MATKEAWNLCKQICEQEKVKAPTLRTFKWHLRNSNAIQADLVPNPFGGAGPDKVYAVTVEAVMAFVALLKEKGDAMHIVVGQTKPESPGIPKTPAAPKKPMKKERELTSSDALEYLTKKVGRGCELNATTFGIYLAYDLIPWRWDGKQRMVRQDDLDAYLELAPDGVYANHLDYDVGLSRGPGELSLKEAYDYYNDIDPSPITLTGFRSLVAAGLIPAIRTTNDAKAPIVGFKKRDIDAFLATRQRLMEKNNAPSESKTPISPTVKKLMDEAVAKAMPHLAEVKPQPAPASRPKAIKLPKAESKPQPKSKPKTVEKTAPVPAPKERKPRWAPTKEAYAYYCERTKKPLTDSWFRDKVYRGKIFRAQVKKDERANNPSGKMYYVDLNSVDDYLAQDPKTKPKPQKAWPTEKAYHKFRELIPPGLSMLQFKRLVNGGLIKSFTRNSVTHVRVDAVESYFEGLAEIDTDQPLGMGAAYDYYCSRCTDPVAKAHFSRLVTQGEIEGGERNDDGLWEITMASIDEFVERYPTGRLRANRNSRVAREPDAKSSAKLAEVPDPVDPATPSVPAPAPGSAGSISISLSNYSDAAEMKQALEMLVQQGFQVDVKP